MSLKKINESIQYWEESGSDQARWMIEELHSLRNEVIAESMAASAPNQMCLFEEVMRPAVTLI